MQPPLPLPLALGFGDAGAAAELVVAVVQQREHRQGGAHFAAAAPALTGGLEQQVPLLPAVTG